MAGPRVAQPALRTRGRAVHAAHGGASRGGGIALIFARTETKLWQELVFPVAHAVLFVAGRIRFCHADGTEGESATAPSALIAYSARDVAALENSGIEGFIVYLKPKGENK